MLKFWIHCIPICRNKGINRIKNTCILIQLLNNKINNKHFKLVLIQFNNLGKINQNLNSFQIKFAFFNYVGIVWFIKVQI